ncbi:hypothetical protein O185_21445 [Photorhabdus temperata J3]|uniref:Uncharacterized protein n=1 Tax=Photorhabdus temperata J3 TaxID=1389415 RepID=U7QX25_PHOTE|nr:hypothetical protein O185_21445 [Photorhabdus temperata J3]
MDIFNSLNQSFFETCEKIDKLWQKRRRTIDTKMVVLFLMKIITGKNKHGYGYIINEIWDSCIREKNAFTTTESSITIFNVRSSNETS